MKKEKLRKMAETKFGLSQVEKPAPLWYRRLSNALIIFIIPGLSSLIQGWGLSDKLTNRWLLLLTFIPACLKGIGVLLGNGQNYTTEKITILVIGCILLAGCMTDKKVTGYLYRNPDLGAAYCATAWPARVEYKPGTVVTRVDTAYMHGDSIPCPPAAPGQTVYVKVPDVRTITVYRDRVDTATVLDSAAMHSAKAETRRIQAQVTTLNGKLSDEKETSAFWRKWALWAAGAVLGLGAWNFRKPIIGLISKII